MTACEYCRSKLLHRLYGLLDEDEERDLRSHLSGCEACRDALARAEEHKLVLSEAAKGHHPDVRFAAPVGKVLFGPQSGKSPVRWSRWALAACLLLTLGGATAAMLGWQARAARLAEAEAMLAQANVQASMLQTEQQQQQQRLGNELAAIQDEIRKVNEQWEKQTTNVRRIISDRSVQVIIEGPKNFQAGARNTYQIELKRKNQALRGETLLAQVVNPESKEVLFERQLANLDRVDIDLPPDLPVKPGAKLELVVKANLEKDTPVQFSEPLPLLASLFMTQLTTDRPMYRPGETVHFRSLTLQRFNLKPVEEDFVLQYRITNPSNAEIFKLERSAKVTQGEGQQPIKGPDGNIIRGIGAGSFPLPADLSGGEYTLHVSEAENRFPAEKRKFIVNRYQAPRLNKDLDFTRKSYGAGEEVQATCKVARAEGGGIIANQPVIATLNVDGNVQRAALKTDAKGHVIVKFKLPTTIDRGDASLAVQFFDGGNTETLVRPVPVVLKKLFVDFYPEGGDLIAGVPNRVYFQAQTTLGKPAELRGKLVDETGKVITELQTLNDDAEPGVNQGMGVFSLTPEAGKKYEVKVDVPIGIESKHVLPEARTDGVGLTAPDGVVTTDIAIGLHNLGKDRKLMIGAYCRGRLLDSSGTIDVKMGEEKALTLNTVPGISGVYRITVFDVSGTKPIPVAERLIYRRPVEKVNLKIATDRDVYTPGERVKLSVHATNERQQMTPVIALVSVVDLSIIKLADEKTARAMPTHFYMTNEIKNPEELEYADFLVSEHPKAEVALDLLLGTQGWRRFAEQDPAQFRTKFQAEANRILMASGQGVQRRVELDQLALERIDKEFAPKLIALQKDQEAKAQELQNRLTRLQQEQQALSAQVAQAQQSVHRVHSDLHMFTERLPVWGVLGAAGLALVLGIGAIGIGIARFAMAGPHAIGYVATGASLLVLLVLVGAVAVVSDVRVGGDRRVFFAANELADRAAPLDPAGPIQDMAEAPKAEMLNDELANLAVPAEGGAPGLAGPQPNRRLGEHGAARPEQLAPQAQERFGAERMKKAAPPMAGAKPATRPAPPAAMAPMMDEAAERDARAAPRGDFGRIMPLNEPVPVPAGGPMPMFRQQMERWDGDRLEVVEERLLRARRQLRDLAALDMEPFAVREYAHQRQAGATIDGVRRDFTETLYWHPVLVMPDGHADVTFDLSDSVTRFQVLVAGHSLDGRLGSETFEFASRLPFSIEPKVPVEVTNTDKIIIPVTIANDTKINRDVKVSVRAEALTALDSTSRNVTVAGEKRVRQLFRFQPSKVNSRATLTISGDFGPFTKDTVERDFSVVAEGFPASVSRSDLLEGTAVEEIELPKTWVEGTLECKVQVFPSTLADLQKGLEALLREPGGCFEQSSTSNYPNVLILNYLDETDQVRPEIEQRARGLLKNGYARLTSFECMKPEDRQVRRGYEWFGQTAPPHEALTAYGLLQFRDMSKVFPVDKDMMERTRTYLLAQRDGKGGFKRNARALDSFGRAPEHITAAYIVWALTESGEKEDLTRELDPLAKQANESKDPYFIALVGISLLNTNRTAEAIEVLKKLKDLQQADGHLAGATTSITRSGGRDLEIETTALTTLGWLKANRPAEFQTNVQKAVAWIGKQRGGRGGFGSTQSTILALKTLIAHASSNRKTAEAGTLSLFIEGEEKALHEHPFAANDVEALVVSIPADKLHLLKPGKNKLLVKMTGKNAFPYTLSLSYQTRQPANVDNCPVQLNATLDRNQANEGETVKVKAVVENKSGKGQGMTVAIIGLPAGLIVPEDFKQLKDLSRLQENGTKRGQIDFFELRGRELVLYWRDLAPEQKIEVNIDLICRIPGEFHGPASRAYLYYNADNKFWTEPLAVTINAKE